MNFTYYDDSNVHWDSEENILSICSGNSLGSFSMSCSPLTAASDKVRPNAALLARMQMPAIIGDDSEGSFLEDGESQGQSTTNPSSFDAEIDRVVTPFNPEIPIVRTRVLEELVERMPFPYPSASEPSAKGSGWGGYNFEQQKQQNRQHYQQNKRFWEQRDVTGGSFQQNKRFWEKREERTYHDKKATETLSPTRAAAYQQSHKYLPSQLTSRLPCNNTSVTSYVDRFNRNEDVKMIFREDTGEFDMLLGEYNDDGCGAEADYLMDDERLRLPGAAGGAGANVPTILGGKRSVKRCKPSSPPRNAASAPAPPPPSDVEEQRLLLCEKDIREFDVLLGRGPQIYHHEGNQFFHELKIRIQPSYLEAAKDQKVAISQGLVDTIRDNGGRFLKYDDAEDSWYEVSNRVAREKAAQALRETFTKEDRQKKRLKYKKKAKSNITAGAV